MFSRDVAQMRVEQLFSNPCCCFGPKEAFEVKMLTIMNGFILHSFFFNSKGDNFIFTVRTCSSIHLKSHFEFLLCNGKH